MESTGTYAMLPELFAAGPHPEYREEVMLFGRFVGTWDMHVRFYDEHERLVFDGVGSWEFAFTLDGLGVQDTLQYGLPEHFPAPPGERRMGTTVRAWLPGLGAWRQVWIAPRAGNFIPMEAVAVPEGILVTGIDMDGSRLEWTFTDITPTSFEWTGRTSRRWGAMAGGAADERTSPNVIQRGIRRPSVLGSEVGVVDRD